MQNRHNAYVLSKSSIYTVYKWHRRKCTFINLLFNFPIPTHTHTIYNLHNSVYKLHNQFINGFQQFKNNLNIKIEIKNLIYKS